MTEAYLADRAEMLNWKLRWDSVNARDDDDSPRMGFKSYESDWDTNAVTGNWDYIDLSKKIAGNGVLQLAIDGKGISLSDHQIVFGSTGADSIIGAGESDHLYGMNGNDSLAGKGDDDHLEGGLGADTLDGGDGSDTMLGEGGDDSLNGGADADLLQGGLGSDTYYFASGWGNDTIEDSDGKGKIQIEGIGAITGSGAKKITESVWQSADKNVNYTLVPMSDGHNDLYISFSDRTDTLHIRNYSAEKNVGITLTATLTPPVTTGTFNGDFIKKLTGTTYVLSNGNYVSAGAEANANDLITASAGADSLFGFGGNDGLAGMAGNDVLEGGAGDDLLLGGLGADTLNGGTGNDYMFGAGVGGLSYLTSTAEKGPVAPGPDLARGFSWVAYNAGRNASDISVYKVLGADATSAGADGSNVMNGGAGNDNMLGGSAHDVMRGGDDKDTLKGLGGDDILIGDDGNDDLYGDGIALPDYYDATPGPQHGNDFLVGGRGTDIMGGMGGNDELYGGADNDLMYGDDNSVDFTPLANHGNDYLDGEDGDDTLVGGGRDDTLFGGEGADTLSGDDGASFVPGSYHGKDYLDGENGNDSLMGNGSDDTLFGGAGNDVLWGDSATDGPSSAENGEDYLDGEDGNDTLVGGAKSDTLYGGAGNDQLQGDSSGDPTADADDYLNGEAGNDSLIGDGGKDTLVGGDGDDWLWGGEGDDTLIGGVGSDKLFGGAGHNTYVINAGDGQKLIDTPDTLQANALLAGSPGSTDKVVFGEGITLDNLRLTHARGWVSLWTDNGASLVIGTMSDVDGMVSSLVANFEFADGSTIGFADVLARGFIGDNTSNDMAGTSQANRMEGRGGKDLIHGHEGNDTIDGGTGDDTLLGDEGNDLLTGSAGSDSLSGLAGADTLDGGIGNDSLYGGDGADVYRFGAGSGNDTVFNADADAINTQADTIQIDKAIAPSGVELLRKEDDLLLRLTASNDQMSVKDFFLQEGATSSAVDAITFADGTRWNIATIKTAMLKPTLGNDRLNGYTGNDTISGSDGNDRLDGNAGNDSLNGGNGADELDGGTGADRLDGGQGDDSLAGKDGNDTLDGGAGNDWLDGGNGADMYLFGRGSGQDEAYFDNDAVNGQADSILLGVNITSTDLTLTRRSNATDLDISINGTKDKLRVNDYFDEAGKAARAFENIRFADGTTWSYSKIQTLTSTIITEGISVNSDSRDPIVGGNGNDTLSAFNAATLDGGPGDDLLYGGQTTYLFGIGRGSDTINGSPNKLGTIKLDNTILPSDISLNYSGLDVVFSFKGHTETLRLAGYLAYRDLPLSNGSQIYQVRFADGTTWNRDGIDQRVKPAQATDGDDSYFGSQIAANTFSGLNGSDWVIGGTVNDSLQGDDGDDSLVGMAGNDTLQGGGNRDTLYGDEGDDLLMGGAGIDVLWGGLGNDTLDGGDENDALFLGLGDDTVSWNRGDGLDSIHDESGGQLTVRFGSSIKPTDIEISNTLGPDSAGKPSLYLTLKGTFEGLNVSYWSGETSEASVIFSDGTTWSSAQIYAMSIAGTETDDTLTGYGVDDSMSGLEGEDTVMGYAGNDSLSGGEGADSIDGGYGDDILYGNDGDDLLLGGEYGDDTLIGGKGNDSLIGDQGSDVFVYNLGDGSDTLAGFWGPNHANDIVRFGDGISASDIIFARASGIPTPGLWVANAADLVIQGIGEGGRIGVLDFFSEGNGNKYSPINGMEFANGQIWDMTLLHRMEGRAGIKGTASNDTLTGHRVHGLEGNDLLNGSDGSVDLRLLGPEPLDDLLDGGAGADTLVGGAGNDTYIVDSLADVVRENADQGTDTVESTITMSLGNNLENLWLIGSASINGTGNSVGNKLTGNAGNNRLNGGLGADTMVGSAGDDVYVVDDIGDTFTLDEDNGNDLVESSINYTLPRPSYGAGEIERLTLTGINAINANGNQLENVLTGNAAENRLDGGGGESRGADTMSGGLGNDTYVVDWTEDVVIEAASAGTDTVESSVSYTLNANVENLMLTDYALTATGNALANTLTGYVGKDSSERFDGGAGADVMTGDLGDDTYVVDNIADKAIEKADEGTDTVEASINWTLGDNLENLTLTGSGELTATGNQGANTLRGNAGDNVLDGGLGKDTLVGGAGNDSYVIDSADDVITEAANQGTDTVKAAFTYTLKADLENLTLTGTAAANGTGNNVSNALTGNAGVNTLTGAEGNDTLDAGAGNDILNGGTGADTYVFGRGYGLDTLQDKDATAGVKDQVKLGAGIVQADLKFTKVGNNLQAAITGTTDTLVLQDWYLGNQYHVEEFRFSDGSVLTDAQAQGLVSAMAAFTSPAPSHTGPDNVWHGRQPDVLVANALM